jgi:MFS family permease
MENEPSAPFPWQRNLLVVFVGSLTTVMAMSLVLPFLPLYLGELGVRGRDVDLWSGVAYGATFFSAGLVAPLWGFLGDRFGRKPMLVRASLGMAVAMSLMGLAQDPWQLVGLRLLTGLLGGYSSGSMILVATQTPKERSGWALGVLSSGIMAGNLLGPLAGGLLPPLIGIRLTFLAAGAVIFVSFLGTLFLLKGEGGRRRPVRAAGELRPPVPNKPLLAVMLVTGLLLTAANLSVEPILAVYVASLGTAAAQVTTMAGLAFSASALGSLLSAAALGRLADRVGPRNVMVGCLAAAALLMVPQALATAGWQLLVWRFLLGCALGGLLPCLASVLRHAVPSSMAGRMLGLSTSAQYAGQVIGPVGGGFIAGFGGVPLVLAITGAVLLATAGLNVAVSRARS